MTMLISVAIFSETTFLKTGMVERRLSNSWKEAGSWSRRPQNFGPSVSGCGAPRLMTGAAFPVGRLIP